MSVNPFGVEMVVLGLAGLLVIRWAVTRRRAGRPLPRLLRSWEVFGRRPRLSVAVVCIGIAYGVVVAAGVF